MDAPGAGTLRIRKDESTPLVLRTRGGRMWGHVLRVWGSGLRVWVLRSRVWGLGSRVWGLGSRV